MTFNEAETIIGYINDEDYESNDWEHNFIESILERGRDLTTSQTEKLQQIYEKATGGGIQRRHYT